MLCCIAIGFFELPGLAGGFLFTKNSPPAQGENRFLCSRFFGEQLLLAVFDDATAGNDADEGVFIIHHRDKVLILYLML